MQHWNVRKSNTGFTLIETLAAVIMVGILAAIAAPNLLGLLNRNRVNQGLAELEGAIKEAQRQAIRNGKSCTITIDTSDNEIAGGCLLSTRNLYENLDMATNLSDNGTPNEYDIEFSGKGNTSNSGAIFVVYMSSATNQQKCFVIDNSLGATRTGDYTGDPTGTLNLNSCS